MTKTGIATLALLASAGIATAGEPMEITEVQLDYLTASSGGGIFNT